MKTSSSYNKLNDALDLASCMTNAKYHSPKARKQIKADDVREGDTIAVADSMTKHVRFFKVARVSVQHAVDKTRHYFYSSEHSICYLTNDTQIARIK